MFRSFRHSLIGKIVFTHDVRVAILVITQNGGGHIDVRVIPGGIEVFSYVNSFFFLNLQNCTPRDRKCHV